MDGQVWFKTNESYAKNLKKLKIYDLEYIQQPIAIYNS